MLALDLHSGEERDERMTTHPYDGGCIEREKRGALLRCQPEAVCIGRSIGQVLAAHFFIVS
jgi:hypothetical protein